MKLDRGAGASIHRDVAPVAGSPLHGPDHSIPWRRLLAAAPPIPTAAASTRNLLPTRLALSWLPGALALCAAVPSTASASPRSTVAKGPGAVVRDAADDAAAGRSEVAESPWLVTPTFSVDPKLGSTLGGVAGDIGPFEPDSNPSLLTSFGGYSNADSRHFGFAADTWVRANEHRLMFGAAGGEVRNEYDDFLGRGLPAETQDNLGAEVARELHRVKGGWYGGVQGISTDDAIGAEGLLAGALNQIGPTGLRKNGLGLVAEFDDRDNVRNATLGQQFPVHNVAYREGLGVEESFDALDLSNAEYFPFGEGNVLATDIRGRWTKDAPNRTSPPSTCAATPEGTTWASTRPRSSSTLASTSTGPGGRRSSAASGASTRPSPTSTAPTPSSPWAARASSTTSSPRLASCCASRTRWARTTTRPST